MKKKNCLFTFAVILLSIALTGCSVSKNLINTAKNVSGSVTSKSSSSSTTSRSSGSVSSSNFNLRTHLMPQLRVFQPITTI